MPPSSLEMKPIQCSFSNESMRSPFVKSVCSYDISGGILEYDGYFNSENMLPLQCTMCLYQLEEKPYKVEGYRIFYNYVFETMYCIEIYKHDTLEDTSIFSDSEEDRMRFCFMPTHREKIWFRVLDILKEE